MAKANPVSLCIKCEGEIPKGVNQCPLCRAVQNHPDQSPFGAPDYVVMQYSEMKKTRIAMKKSEADKQAEEEKLKKERADWFRNNSDEDKAAAMEEAFYTIKEVILSKASIDTVKKVTKLGRRIGDLATAVEAYASKGGSFNASTSTGSETGFENYDET